MRRMIALLLTLVLAALCATVSVGAVPAEDPIDIYEQDIVFTNGLAFAEPVVHYQPYSWMTSENWDSAPMIFAQSNEYEEGIYYFNFPEEGVLNPEGATAFSFFISDASETQRTVIGTFQKNDTLDLSLTGETDNSGYYKFKTRHVNSENLIVLDNTDNTLSDDIYICCRCITPYTNEESELRAKMERFDFNEYGYGRYRFTAPNGTQSYYFTDGSKRTAEMPFNGAECVYLTGDCGYDGNYEVYKAAWAGGPDPVYTMGPSHTTFDRFFEEYVAIYAYDVDPEDVYWSDFFCLYDEPYEHRDQSGSIDWVLIQAETFIGQDVIYEGIIGNRLVFRPTPSYPFESGYGIYDVKQDVFLPVGGETDADYEGLTKALDEFVEGRLFGDLDGDDSITVVDATIIQRCDADMCDYPGNDKMVYPRGKLSYYSDFNRDGARDIVVSTCIQRYLADIPYTVYM